MAGQTALNDLIEALAGAVIEAQDRIEQHQMANLGDYFDEFHRPKSVIIRLPSQHPQAGEDDEDYYRAPLLPLVSTNVLRIKDVEISFDAQLGDMGGLQSSEGFYAPPPPPSATDPAAAQGAWRSKRSAAKSSVRVDTSASAKSQRHSAVHVVLRVEGTEPTDGAARLMNHLAQTQGVFKTVMADKPAAAGTDDLTNPPT
ncbi:DUF2589 domain-containing protein [Xanthomonas graminis]|jgi:hypothetical protein|uniref:DUF2589 domain-containing protein n=1 Tax=Xanthomonas graminis pv. graminis TaxID=134874 RepID=A0A1M4J7Q7_9XANT|nr:DUF2589 domain-containing protein [Xanthomonas translucens]EKU24522.1 hypothetical protein XTG29_02614 [Xanthomonas translucens pv. graminis ART-Xtg29]OAX58996.1 hypothetical protein A6R72_03085 [Xanthomonas translucens pv. graminis]UKE55763.1 DUF2589 domain-containing protein [Xanthomonas translucens pv. graminis]WIH07290.1 DUF2589 domain-containing protein [Xanthomonas translucens pv. graminis]WIH13884.1 DUF2589 domain-containing protein [Xanthomonas translucens pv. graminis]